MIDRMSGESGIGPLSPQDRSAYEKEYRQGLDLFKRALDDYSHAKNMFQKAEFKEVMEKAMRVLNETATELHRNELLAQNETISKDFSSFDQEDNSTNIAQLKKDINRARDSGLADI